MLDFVIITEMNTKTSDISSDLAEKKYIVQAMLKNYLLPTEPGRQILAAMSTIVVYPSGIR